MWTVRLMGVAAAALAAAGCGRAERAQFSALVLESRAQQGEQVLKQAFVLQEGYRARHARYAATFAELAEVGWENPQGLDFHHPPRIVRAAGDELCMEMQPREDNLWPQHVDQTGQVQRGPCP